MPATANYCQGLLYDSCRCRAAGLRLPQSNLQLTEMAERSGWPDVNQGISFDATGNDSQPGRGAAHLDLVAETYASADHHLRLPPAQPSPGVALSSTATDVHPAATTWRDARKSAATYHLLHIKSWYQIGIRTQKGTVQSGLENGSGYVWVSGCVSMMDGFGSSVAWQQPLCEARVKGGHGVRRGR